jgi:hypothetical protein
MIIKFFSQTLKPFLMNRSLKAIQNAKSLNNINLNIIWIHYTLTETGSYSLNVHSTFETSVVHSNL